MFSSSFFKHRGIGLGGAYGHGGVAKCDEGKPPIVRGAYGDEVARVALNPRLGHESGFGKDCHHWGYDKLPKAQLEGQKMVDDKHDNQNHAVLTSVPHPIDARGFHAKVSIFSNRCPWFPLKKKKKKIKN